MTPLHIAARKGNIEIVKNLIEFGANIEERNQENKTPFTLANENGHNKVAKFLLEKKMEAKNQLPQENMSNKALCIICLNPRNGLYALIPCMHVSLCEPCCFKITKERRPKCPSCRKPIQKYEEIFFQEASGSFSAT